MDGVLKNIETERLVLRQLIIEDKTFILKHFSDVDVCKYFDQEPFSKLEEAEELIQWYANPDKDPWRRWGIVKKEDNVLIGTCGYHKWDKKNMRVEIGYDLYKDYWGSGYMSEAIKVLIEYCFVVLKVNRIDALTHLHNDRSINILSRFGFVKEGILREYVYCGGKFDDQLSLSLLNREWAAS